MTTSQSDQEFDDLLDQLCEGLLSDPEWQRLVELLGQSETHRQRYLNYIELHASLWSGGAVRPALSLPLPTAETPLKPPAAPTSPVLGFLGSLNISAESRAARVFFWAAATLCVGMFVTMIAFVTVIIHDVESRGNQRQVSVDPAGVCGPGGRRRLSMGRSGIGPRRWRHAGCRPEVGVGVRAGGNRLSERGRGETPRTGHLRDPVGQQRFSDDRAAQRPCGHPRVARLYRSLADGGDGGPGDGIQRCRLGGRTQPDSRRRRGGRSAVGQRAARRRLGVGQSIEVEPGTPSVIARIEPGEGTPAFKFPTIEPPSSHDYADASQGHARIRVLRGRPHFDSGPVEVLLDGKGQSKPDSPRESFFFNQRHSGMILLDLGQKIPVKKVNTYSWHHRLDLPRDHTRATQKYYLYGSSRATPPGCGRKPGGRRLDADRAGEHRRVLRFSSRDREARATGRFHYGHRWRSDRRVSLFALGRSTDPGGRVQRRLRQHVLRRVRRIQGGTVAMHFEAVR